MAERPQKTLNGSNMMRVEGSSLSPRTSSEFQAPRSPSMGARPIPSPSVSHRHSFSDHFRGIPPPSPRASRHPSISLQNAQALSDNPPKAGAADPVFIGRDWHTIAVGELIDPSDVRFVEVDTNIEHATNILIDSGVSVLLIRTTAFEKSAVSTFDFRDLNQYLLFATGSMRPNTEHMAFYQDLAKKAKSGQPIALRDAKNLGSKEPFVTVPHTAKLTKVIEAFGSGVHRLIVVKEWTNEVVGIISQFRLVKFLWENGQSFPVIDQLYHQTLRDLQVGSRYEIICVNGDKPLREALLLMDVEGVSSMAVVDAQQNVVGNISTADVRLLTKASSAPLLDNSCMHFISVILSTRGMNDGKDSFPVFHVSPYSTLAHTVAKLVATKSHRMWVVESPSPSSSTPSTPLLPPSGPPAMMVPPRPASPQVFPPFNHNLSSSPSVSASAGLPGLHMSGRLSGVVSLTDILNLCARASGLNPLDPWEMRQSRRRSSSASLARSDREGSVRSSIDEKR